METKRISILQINDSKVCFPLDIFAIIQFAAIDNVRKVIVSNYNIFHVVAETTFADRYRYDDNIYYTTITSHRVLMSIIYFLKILNCKTFL